MHSSHFSGPPYLSQQLGGTRMSTSTALALCIARG